MTDFIIEPRGSFSLAQSRGFLKGFTPAMGTALTEGDDLVLSFLLDKSYAPVAVRLTQSSPNATVHARVYANDTNVDVDGVKHQVERMLALNADGRGYDAILEGDAKLRAVANKFPGFRPVSFSSPYEAAVWAVLTQRIPMKVASAIRRKIAEQFGTEIDVDGAAMHVFPSPHELVKHKSVATLPEEKWLRLQGIARAAIAGDLDADRIAAMSIDNALAHLGKLRGIGLWSASHIHQRGTGATDLFSLSEPRVLAAIQFAYGDPTIDEARATAMAEKWRPYRTWAMVLIVLHLGRYGDWRVDGAKRGGSLKKTSSKKSSSSSSRKKSARTVGAKKKTSSSKKKATKPAKKRAKKTTKKAAKKKR